MPRAALPVLTCILLLTCAARGQEPSPPPRAVAPTLELNVGATTGDMRPGWAPVEVKVQNPGPARRVKLTVSLWRNDAPMLTCHREVALPERGRVREWFTLPFSESWGHVEVVLSDLETGEVLTRLVGDQLTVRRPYSYGRGRESRILFLGENAEYRQASWLIDRNQTTWLEVAEPDRLPDRALAMDAFDLVVLRDVDLSAASPASQEALVRWVHAGGKVLLVPGRRLAWFRDPAIQRFIPGTSLTSHKLRRLELLETRYGAFRGSLSRREPFEVFVPDGAGVDLTRTPGGSLNRLVERLPNGDQFRFLNAKRLGKGWVYLLAADPARPPFDRWMGRSSVTTELRRVIFSTQARIPRAALNNQNPALRPELCQLLDSDEDPSQALVVLLVILYILCVGPLNYIVLRRLDKTILLVVTVPALSLVFSGVVVASGYLTKGVRTVVWRATVLDTQLGERLALEQTAVSIRSAVAADYSVELDPSLVGLRVHRTHEAAYGTRLVLEDPHDGKRGFRFPGITLNMWEQAVFEGAGIQDLGGAIAIDRPTAGLRVTNGTRLTFRRAIVQDRTGALYVTGEIPPGKRAVAKPGPRGVTLWGRRIEHELNRLLDPDPEHGQFMRESLNRYASARTRGLTFVGVLDDPPSRVTVDGREDTDREACLLVAWDHAQ